MEWVTPESRAPAQVQPRLTSQSKEVPRGEELS